MRIEAKHTPLFRGAARAVSDRGIPARAESLLLHAVSRWPRETAIEDAEESTDYASLSRLAAGFAKRLRTVGVAPGDRVAIFLDKSEAAVAALFGAWAAGAIVVPVNEGLKTRQVAHILSHSGAAALVTTPRKLSRLDPDSYRGVTLVDPCAAPAEPFEPAPGPPEALILYTSGSTGLPKGILISHANLMAGTGIVARYLGLRQDERILSVLPFSFDYGLNQLLTSVHVGATLVLQRSHLPAEICRTLAARAITGLAGVPPLWIQLFSETSPFRRMAFPDLRYITNSGGCFPVDLVRRYRTHLPHTRIFLMYGLSEAFRSTYLDPAEIDSRPGSIGKAIPECEVLVVREDGSECAPDEVGELVHRGPTVALGYWNDPEATARVFRPDTLPGGDPRQMVVYSGDLARKDVDGFLYFAGRRDQMIKSLGFRVSPEEIEEAMLACPLVEEVAVCGAPDAERGTAIVAHVVPRGPAPFDTQAFARHCRKELASHMQPRDVIVRDSLPRTATGKVDRQGLMERAL